ncbi:hypothetical protein BDZ94DRAFT_1247912 [Collybia nuda]|uniref:Uncharacterized protein n=1 Tax=Collybia nuda TaxID=64659 RepID=A0A9P5YFC4_9AGAR|nr:hypothetical protein BDZ94DRAFT_1247912 [Collybia nuda]
MHKPVHPPKISKYLSESLCRTSFTCSMIFRGGNMGCMSKLEAHRVECELVTGSRIVHPEVEH